MAHISPDFIQHIQKQLPANIQLEELLEACQRPLRKSLRANLLSSTPEILQAELESLGYTLTPIPWCDEGFWIDASEKALPDNLGNWLPHLQGQCYIQEASSMLPVKALLHDFSYSESSTFLDMAAAPGSKTTQLAAQLNNQGLIVANELSSSRLKGLHHNLQRCGVKNTALSHADGRLFGDKTPQYFDAILLDAPCGGEGTVRKDEQALANWDIASVQSISALQQELICSAYRALKPGDWFIPHAPSPKKKIKTFVTIYSKPMARIFQLSHLPVYLTAQTKPSLKKDTFTYIQTPMTAKDSLSHALKNPQRWKLPKQH